MAEAPIRIALLARAGEAREQLRRALTELGADLVAEGDPKEVDPTALYQLMPKVVLISLDPADEDALDRFDAVLSAEGVEVMLDDAEVTSKLDGWDLARWARHLAAKLVGSELLPPAPQGSESLADTDFTPVPGAPPTPAQLMDGARLEDYAAEASGLMLDVPTTPSLAEVELPALDGAPDAAGLELEEISLDVDLSMLEQAMSAPMVTGSAEEQPGDDAAASFSFDEGPEAPMRSFGEMAASSDAEPSFSLDVDLEGLERSLAEGGVETSLDGSSGLAEPGLDTGSGLLMDFDSDQPVNFGAFAQDDDSPGGVMDETVAALAAQLDAQVDSTPGLPDLEFPTDRSPSGAEARDGRKRPPVAAEPPAAAGLPDLDLPSLDLPAARTSLPAEPEKPTSSFGSLELSLLDEPGLPAAPTPAFAPVRAAPTPAPTEPKPAASGSFSGLSLSLEGDEPAGPSEPVGTPAVPAIALILAGLGGPDAVRQLLATLPPSFPVPVLLFQHLDNGKYDRLADQLAKGSKLPVVLGKPDQSVQPRHVTVLQAGLGIVADGEGFRFIANSNLAQLVKRLPAGSAVLMLSGADADLIPDLIVANRSGTRLFAQSPDSCFDATATTAAIAAGATAGAAAELAQQLATRWRG